LREEDMKLLVANRTSAYQSISSLLDAGISIAALEKLADADAFRSIGIDRRKALWEVAALADTPNGMFTGQSADITKEQGITLPEMSMPEHVLQDYGSMALSLKAHPVGFVREKLSLLHAIPSNNLNDHKDGEIVKVAGLVLVRQRPGTASGICFITIEDETGIANLVVFKNLFDKFRKEILQSKLLMVEGKLQREGEVTHVIVSKCFNVTGLLNKMSASSQDQSALLTLSRADERDDGGLAWQKDSRTRTKRPLQADIFSEGRNFK
ncbi:MAG: OB-fold nucleic acid binding domain-containing protein, partial [Daejeonella sp.]